MLPEWSHTWVLSFYFDFLSLDLQKHTVQNQHYFSHSRWSPCPDGFILTVNSTLFRATQAQSNAQAASTPTSPELSSVFLRMFNYTCTAYTYTQLKTFCHWTVTRIHLIWKWCAVAFILFIAVLSVTCFEFKSISKNRDVFEKCFKQ